MLSLILVKPREGAEAFPYNAGNRSSVGHGFIHSAKLISIGSPSGKFSANVG